MFCCQWISVNSPAGDHLVCFEFQTAARWIKYIICHFTQPKCLCSILFFHVLYFRDHLKKISIFNDPSSVSLHNWACLITAYKIKNKIPNAGKVQWLIYSYWLKKKAAEQWEFKDYRQWFHFENFHREGALNTFCLRLGADQIFSDIWSCFFFFFFYNARCRRAELAFHSLSQGKYH